MSSDFRILGELEVLQEGRPVDLGSPRQGALLARLVVSAGEVVSTDRLIDDLWYEAAPDKARHTLQVYVSRLRKELGDDGAVLERCGSGYRLAAAPDSVDAARFESLAVEGQLALSSGDPEAAGSLLGTALDLCRGPGRTRSDPHASGWETAPPRVRLLQVGAVPDSIESGALRGPLESGHFRERVIDVWSRICPQTAAHMGALGRHG